MRDIETLLAYEISRKPALKDIEDRLDSIDIDDLADMPFPLKWIKEGFIRKKQRLIDEGKRREIMKLVSQMDLPDSVFIDVNSPDPEGQLIFWNGDETFLRVHTGSQLNVLYGRYLFMPDRGGVFIDNVFSKIIDPVIYQSGKPAGRSTLSGYKSLCSEIRNKNAPGDAPIIDLSPAKTSPMSRLGAMGVRFS